MKNKTYSRLNKSFSDLRKIGYFAKQSFQCCSSCGWAAIPEKESNKAVFYHIQDADNKPEGLPMYLSWDGNGKEIVGVFIKNGINVEWDGKKKNRILISNYKN